MTRAPQSKLAVSTSSRLAAEKFSSPFQIVIVLLNLITHRTNCAAGRACNPSLLTISTSLRMQFKASGQRFAVLIPQRAQQQGKGRLSAHWWRLLSELRSDYNNKVLL